MTDIIHPDRLTPPPVTSFTEISIPSENKEVLPNGIEFHYVDMGEQPVSRMAMFWEGGLLDTDDKAAMAIMAQTFREQTRTFSDDTIADIIDFNGARIASRAENHLVSLELIALNSKLPDLLPVVRSIITESEFNERNAGAVARKLSAARAVEMGRVSFQAVNEARRLVQGNDHPASSLILPDQFEAVTTDRLLRLYDRMKQARLHVFIGGALGKRNVSLIRDFVAGLDCGTERPVTIRPFEPENIDSRIHIEMPQSKQSAVAMTLPVIGRDNPDYIALRFTIMALGGYFGSRLMHNIREEKGLTYGISASLLGSQEGAYMEVSAQCAEDCVEQLIEESIKEIRNLVAEPPAGDELYRLRQYAWSQLAASADSSFGVLDHYITKLRVATPDNYFTSQLSVLDKLSPSLISEMAEKYLNPDSLRIVTSGI